MFCTVLKVLFVTLPKTNTRFLRRFDTDLAITDWKRKFCNVVIFLVLPKTQNNSKHFNLKYSTSNSRYRPMGLKGTISPEQMDNICDYYILVII